MGTATATRSQYAALRDSINAEMGLPQRAVALTPGGTMYDNVTPMPGHWRRWAPATAKPEPLAQEGWQFAVVPFDPGMTELWNLRAWRNGIVIECKGLSVEQVELFDAEAERAKRFRR